MKTRDLKRALRIGLVLTPLLGLASFGLTFAGVPTLSGWGFFIVPALVFGLVPLLLGYFFTFLTPLQRSGLGLQVTVLLSVLLLSFFAIFMTVPIIDSSSAALAARQSFYATIAIGLEHLALLGYVRAGSQKVPART